MKEKLSDIAHLISGQILCRVEAKDGDEFIEEKTVLTPKAISDSGMIEKEYLERIKIKEKINTSRITKLNDIVIKLTTPYDAALITEDNTGLLVPSFCSIIRLDEVSIAEYVTAFINSSTCKAQIRKNAVGYVNKMLTVGKLGEIELPDIDSEEMINIGYEYRKSCKRIELLSNIISTEKMRNDLLFSEVNRND